MLFEGIRGLFGGSSNPFGQQAAMAQPLFPQESQFPPDSGNPVPDDFRNNDSSAAAYDDSTSNQDDNSYDPSNDDLASDSGSSSDDDSWA